MRRFTLRRALPALVALVALIYAGAIVRLMMQETQLIFRTDDARSDHRPPFPFEQVDLPRSDGAKQFGWVMKSGSGTEPGASTSNGNGTLADRDGLWILYLHGNATTIGGRMNVKHYVRLHELGLNVFAPEYRGYNGLDGVPTEAGLAADARVGYDYLRKQGVPPERLVIYGWSLGAAVAVDLASQVEVSKVILEGAPASIVDIGQQRYPFMPIRMIIRNPFNAIEKVGGIHAPLLFLHSPEDTVIPFSEGRRLYEAAPSPKTFVDVTGGHVECSEVDSARFYGAIGKFLRPLL